jgi:hypothetical protein
MRKVLIASIIAAFLVGCAAPKPQPDVRMLQNTNKNPPPPSVIPPKLSITPLIGSQQDDAKVVRDFGVVLKAWIAPYEDKTGNLVASHNVYVVVKEAGWIGAETLPQRATGLRSPTGQVPFVVRPEGVDSSSDFSNEEIKKFLNEVSEMLTKTELPAPKVESLDKNDATILNYLRSQGKEVNSTIRSAP